MLARLRALFLRAQTSDDMDEELRIHLDRETERNVAAGMSPDEARLAARRAFGNVTYHKEEMRDAVGVRWIEQTLQDVRFALRSFRRSPTFAVTVVATIAMALGLNTSAFTIFNTYVLRPIQVRDPFSLYQMNYVDDRGRWHSLTRDQYEALRSVRPDAETFAYRVSFARMEGRPSFGMLTTGNALQVLGARPHLGRGLLPEDADGNGNAVMVLLYDTWRGRFGADSTIVGRMLRVQGMALRVVGVMGPEFRGVGSVPPDYWAPITLASALDGAHTPAAELPVRAVIRLRPGETDREAAAMLGTWAARITAQEPDTSRARSVALTSLARVLPPDTETYLVFVPTFVAFALVMLIACANVANMLLARALARQREIGIRLALGAERRRLVRQLLTESTMLALPAAVIGFVLSRWTIAAGVRAMFATMPPEFVPYVHVIPMTPDARVFAFILIASVSAALLFGLAPALQATRPRIVAQSRGDFDAGFRTGRMRAALLVVQVTVCALLLIVTGVLLRGAAYAQHVETGMSTSNVVFLSPDERGRERTIATLRGEPIVTELAASDLSPLDGMYPTIAMRYNSEQQIPRAARNDKAVAQVSYDFVTANYFATLGVRVLHGRTFTEDEEREGLPVAVVSAATAERLWPGRDPIGQTLALDADVPRESRLWRVRSARVVGVTSNTVTGWLGTGLERSVAYFPAALTEDGMKFLARVTGDETRARDRLDRETDRAVPSSPMAEIHTLNDFLAVQRYPFAAFSWVSAAIGVIALLLTVSGIYGVLSYLVAQRTKEIGIRMALGAGGWRVVGTVLRETSLLGIVGVSIGTILALAASRLVGSTLVIVNTFDVAGYAIGVVVVLLGALLAAFGPARRAARVNPLEALRAD